MVSQVPTCLQIHKAVLSMYRFLFGNHTLIKYFKKWGGEGRDKELELLLLPAHGNLERGPQFIALSTFKSFLVAHFHLLSKCSPVTCK